MSSATPSIPLFGDAYMADTRHLSLEEHGAYLQLLMIAWRIEGCCLPDDDSRLARMLGVTAAKWRKLKPTVMAFWTLDSGTWKQARLTREREFVEQKRAKNKAAAETRWNGQASENNKGDECERISERNAPPPPPHKKEGSVSNDTGGEAADPVKQIFDMGVSLIVATGKTEKQARTLVGKWREGGKRDGEVLAALTDCRVKSIMDPVEYCEKRFKRARFVSASGYEYRGSASDVMREAERRADWDTYWAAKAESEAPQSTGPPRRSNGQRGRTASIGQLTAGMRG